MRPTEEGISPFICGICSEHFVCLMMYLDHFTVHQYDIGKQIQKTHSVFDGEQFVKSTVKDQQKTEICAQRHICTLQCSKCGLRFAAICKLHEHFMTSVNENEIEAHDRKWDKYGDEIPLSTEKSDKGVEECYRSSVCVELVHATETDSSANDLHLINQGAIMLHTISSDDNDTYNCSRKLLLNKQCNKSDQVQVTDEKYTEEQLDEGSSALDNAATETVTTRNNFATKTCGDIMEGKEQNTEIKQHNATETLLSIGSGDNNDFPENQQLRNTSGCTSKLRMKSVESNGDSEKDYCTPLYKKRRMAKQKLKDENKELTDKKIPCEVCGVLFIKKNLSRHQLSHTEVKTHKCGICSKLFKTRDQLYAHTLHHKKEKDMICDYCGKGFNNGPNLRQHVKIHTRERTLHCPLCPKMFRSRYILKDHINRHSDNKPYICEQCGKSFRTGIEVTRHLKVHSDERPYPCQLCEKSFKSRSNLIKHGKTHRLQ